MKRTKATCWRWQRGKRNEPRLNELITLELLFLWVFEMWNNIILSKPKKWCVYCILRIYNFFNLRGKLHKKVRLGGNWPKCERLNLNNETMDEFFPLVSLFFDKHMEKIQEMGSSFPCSSPFPLPWASSDKIRTSALCHWPPGLNLTAKTSLTELAEGTDFLCGG